MAESQPEAFGRCFGKRWPTVGLGLPTRSVIQDLRREMLPFCDLPSPSEKCGSVFWSSPSLRRWRLAYVYPPEAWSRHALSSVTKH